MRSVQSAFKPFVKRPAAPLSDPSVAALQPPAKRPRTEPSVTVLWPAQTPTASQQATRDKILQQLAADPGYLDLTNSLAAELLLLPPEMLGSAAARVTHLRLPSALPRLPAICQAMPELRLLHLPHFMGDTLDLQAWPSLDRVEGSAGICLNAVHADARTELDIDVPLRLRKVRVQRYVHGQPGRTHALPGHAYTYIAPGASEPDNTQLNGVAHFSHNGQPIVCRHIARHVHDAWNEEGTGKLLAGGLPAPGYAGIAKPEDVATRVRSDTQERYCADMAFSYGYTFFDNTGFGSFAADQLEVLMHRARRSQQMKVSIGYYLSTTNHVTNLLLKAKPTTPPVYTVTLIDPNTFLARTRIEANSLDAIRHVAHGWRLDQLIKPERMRNYADPAQPAIVYAFSTRRRSPEQRPLISTYLSRAQLTNGEMFFSMLQLGLHEMLAPALKQLVDGYERNEISGLEAFRALQARCMTGEIGLSVALQIGRLDCVREFVAAVERLAEVKTSAHLLNFGPGKLPDNWCDTLLTIHPSWSDIAASKRPQARECLTVLVKSSERLLAGRHLSADACLNRIAQGHTLADGHPGWNVIDAALATKDQALLSELQQLLTALHKCGAVSRQQCASLVKDTALLDQWLPPEPAREADLFTTDPVLALCFPDQESLLQADKDFSINWWSEENSGTPT